MSLISQPLCALGLSTLLLTTAACSGDEPANADGASPSAAPADAVQALDAERGSADEPAPLDPGRYAIPFIGAADDAPWAEVEVPTGWGQDRLLLAAAPDLDPHLRRVELLAIDWIAQDPCSGSTATVQPTVSGFVTALTEQRVVKPGEAQPVSIDGYSGQLIQFRVPSGTDVEKCTSGESLRPFGPGRSWTSVFPGWTYRTWVLDVDGDPLVVFAAHGPDTTPSELAELTAMVEGISFVEPR